MDSIYFLFLFALFSFTSRGSPFNSTIFGMRHNLTCGPANSSWILSQENWKDAKVDKNLDIFINGGIDTEGYLWPGTKNQTLSHQLGIQLYNVETWNCSIETPCPHVEHCEDLPRWGYLAMTAFSNLNNQFTMLFVSPARNTIITITGRIELTGKGCGCCCWRRSWQLGCFYSRHIPHSHRPEISRWSDDRLDCSQLCCWGDRSSAWCCRARVPHASDRVLYDITLHWFC